ncbi:hypothetical protein [Litchfieldella rifensis]|uniref:DUF2125 domain-containing protein n=1 Tax=Litchfieldella rifensis TaxID=762643 RepID=A0ABV7LSG4_9GAMM
MKGIDRCRTAVVVLGLVLFPVTSALASAERLEAELQAMFGDTGTLEIGEVSSPLLSLGSRVVAEELVYDSGQGERVRIDSYTVRGDYDAPDAVEIDGLSIENSLSGQILMSAERLRFEEPSRAVFPLTGGLPPEAVHVKGLTIDSIVIDLTSVIAEEMLHDTPLAGGSGRLEIARVEGHELTANRIGWLEVSDMTAVGKGLGELGSGTFRLASLRLDDVRDLGDEEEARIGQLLLSDMAIDTDQLVGAVDRLRLDGDMDDGEGGLWLDGLRLDLNRMIALAPADQRTQMRMLSNVLTDGGGKLDVDAVFEGRWEADGASGILLSQSAIDIADALRLSLDTDIPVAVPEGVEPSAYLAGLDDVEDVMLMGGDVVLHLENRGLFGRLASVGAAMAGVSEQQYIEQARAQARGFGMMLGKDVQDILLALVGMLEGKVSKLTVSAILPAESNLDTYRKDPLGVTERVTISVESR